MAAALVETPTEVFDNLSKFVWIIKVQFRSDWQLEEEYATGFAIGENGLLVTCASLLPANTDPVAILVRRKDDQVFRYQAERVEEERELGILFVKIIGFKDCPTAALADDGSLSYDAHVIHIGHPRQMVWSFLRGRVAYPCIDRPAMPEDFPNQKPCYQYLPMSIRMTPSHRVMGDVWNLDSLIKSNGEVNEDLEFEAQLNPRIPVIQMYGFPTSETAYGGPVFNQKQQVVGMMAPSPEGKDFVYAIHISMLKNLLQKVVKKRAAPPLELGESSETKKLKGH